jgi:hypothetical protein
MSLICSLRSLYLFTLGDKRISYTMSVACQRNYIRYGICFVGRDFSVGTATFYGGWTVRRSNPGGGRDFPHAYRPALGPAQPPAQWVPGLSRWLKRPGRGVYHLPTSSAEVKERVKLYIYSPYGPS